MNVANLFTNIHVTPVNKDRLRAIAGVKVAEAMYITGIRVVEGSKGLFISMPSRKDTKTREYQDVAFPASREVREELQRVVLEEYAKLATPETVK